MVIAPKWMRRTTEPRLYGGMVFFKMLKFHSFESNNVYMSHTLWPIFVGSSVGAGSWHDNCAGGVVNRKFSVLSTSV